MNILLDVRQISPGFVFIYGINKHWMNCLQFSNFFYTLMSWSLENMPDLLFDHCFDVTEYHFIIAILFMNSRSAGISINIQINVYFCTLECKEWFQPPALGFVHLHFIYILLKWDKAPPCGRQHKIQQKLNEAHKGCRHKDSYDLLYSYYQCPKMSGPSSHLCIICIAKIRNLLNFKNRMYNIFTL